MVEVRAWGTVPEFAPGETDLAELLVTISIRDDGNETFGVGDVITFDGVDQVIVGAYLDTFIIDGAAVQVAALYTETGESYSIPFVDGALVPAYPAVSTDVELGFGLPEIPFPLADIICFARGTTIAGLHGDILVEDLKVGDMIRTKDHGPQPVRWIGSTRLGAGTLAGFPHLRPIRISAGALGLNSPESDLLVSPQHRVLVRSRIARRMFDTDEVLVAAKQLLQLEGITVAEELDEVEYFHVLFDRHEIIEANGAEAESLFTGLQALKSVGAAARSEIFSLFPELEAANDGALPARPLVPGRVGRQLAARHRQNVRALVQ